MCVFVYVCVHACECRHLPRSKTVLDPLALELQAVICQHGSREPNSEPVHE